MSRPSVTQQSICLRILAEVSYCLNTDYAKHRVKVSDGFQTTAAGHLVDWVFYSWRCTRHILLATNNKRTKEQVSGLHTQEQLWKSYSSEDFWVTSEDLIRQLPLLILGTQKAGAMVSQTAIAAASRNWVFLQLPTEEFLSVQASLTPDSNSGVDESDWENLLMGLYQGIWESNYQTYPLLKWDGYYLLPILKGRSS